MTGGWFSQTGLTRLHEVMAGHVERGDMPGSIALVARHGRAHVDVIGTGTFGDARPLQRDDVFRMTSMTKPITAAAAMTLVDDGTLDLDAPVDDLIPELANRRVLRTVDARLDDTVPAKRPITLEDLLTFRLGLGMVFAQTPYPIVEAEKELQLATLNPPYPPSPHSTDEWLRRLGTLPLISQPGEQWIYNTGAQVLGAVLERATGRSLDVVLHERILGPLGMGDTAFTVSPAMKDRLTSPTGRPANSPCLTGSRVATGAVHSPFPARRPGCSRPSTTTGPSCECCSTAAHTTADASCRRSRWFE